MWFQVKDINSFRLVMLTAGQRTLVQTIGPTSVFTGAVLSAIDTEL